MQESFKDFTQIFKYLLQHNLKINPASFSPKKIIFDSSPSEEASAVKAHPNGHRDPKLFRKKV